MKWKRFWPSRPYSELNSESFYWQCELIKLRAFDDVYKYDESGRDIYYEAFSDDELVVGWITMENSAKETQPKGNN